MNITPNMKLTVVSDERLEKDSSFYMTSSLEDILPGDVFLITAPVLRELQIPIRNGERLRLSFQDRAASYGFEAEVLERVKKDRLDYLRVKRLSPIIRVQRRQDFRLEIELDGKLDQAYVDMSGERKVRRLPIVTKDVSGGGAFIRLNTQLFVNENVVVYLPLGNCGDIKAFPASVRWCARAEVQDPRWKWYTGIMFRHREQAEKETLVRYLFALQQRLRKMEADKEERSRPGLKKSKE